MNNQDLNTHQMLRTARTGSNSFRKLYQDYAAEFVLN